MASPSAGDGSATAARMPLGANEALQIASINEIFELVSCGSFA
jgi:hypothetical protein